ncbi:hypothetical protein SNE40_018826 [Patella caerulea]|uniref:DUF7042 domain-containing protein n=1 Tax=Patella caerulea TaxID=87958 RepID=A0AAN8P4M8_PATCE
MEIAIYQLIFTALLVSTFTDVSGNCIFPDYLRGHWISSSLGEVSFNSTYLDGITAFTFGKLTFQCEDNNGTKYFLKSETTTFANTKFTAYVCLDLRKVTEDKIYYYRATTKDKSFDNERIIVTSSTVNVSMEEVCNEPEPYNPGSYSLLIRSEVLNTSEITCPNIVRGEYEVTNITKDGTQECPSGISLDVCSVKTHLYFNISSCSPDIPSATRCMFATETDNVTYLTVYSDTDNKFRCVAASEEGNTVFLSQKEGDCSENQNGTSVAPLGYLMELMLINNGTAHCREVVTEGPNNDKPTTTAPPKGGAEAISTKWVIPMIAVLTTFLQFFASL